MRLLLERLHQRGAALADRDVGDVRRGARPDHRPLVLLGVFQEKPGVRTHEEIGAAEDGLAGSAHADIGPSPVEGHQPVDLRDRELQRQNAIGLPGRGKFRDHPGGRRHLGRLVQFEVGEDHPVTDVGRHRLGVGGVEFGIPVGAVDDVGSQIDVLESAVDDVPAAVDQQSVLELESRHDLAEEVLVFGVRPGPGRAVAGIVDRECDVVVLASAGVEGLQIPLRVRGGQQSRGIQLFSAVLLGLGDEVVAVVVRDVAVLCRTDGGAVELVERCGEIPERRQRVAAVGVADQGVVQIPDLGCDRPRLRLPDLGQPAEGSVAQIGAAASEGDGRHGRGRQHRAEHQHHDQFRQDAEPVEKVPVSPRRSASVGGRRR